MSVEQHPNPQAAALGVELLAKLTGGLGDQARLQKIAEKVAQLYNARLPDLIKSETGVPITLHYAGFQSGPMSALLTTFEKHTVVSKAGLPGFASSMAFACGTGFVIGLMEQMLGGTPDAGTSVNARALSMIELDLSATVFEKVGEVLKIGLGLGSEAACQFAAPFNIEDKSDDEAPLTDEFAIAIKLGVSSLVGLSPLVLIIPQRPLLKANIVVPKDAANLARSKEWEDHLNEQVRRSQVTLEARIQLEALTLGTVARLSAGDVIPFLDKSDVEVCVSANNKELYRCEFGRSGEKYTVRVKDNIGENDDILKRLIG